MPSTTTSLPSALPHTARWQAGTTTISDWPVKTEHPAIPRWRATQQHQLQDSNQQHPPRYGQNCHWRQFIKTAQWPTATHCYSRTDTAKEDKNYTGTTAHRSQPNPWSVHEQNRPDSTQPLPRLWSLSSWHPPPFWLPFKADHTDSRVAMNCAKRNRESPKLGDWWDKLTTTTSTNEWADSRHQKWMRSNNMTTPTQLTDVQHYMCTH